jgi:hypothetical protein
MAGRERICQDFISLFPNNPETPANATALSPLQKTYGKIEATPQTHIWDVLYIPIDPIRQNTLIKKGKST